MDNILLVKSIGYRLSDRFYAILNRKYSENIKFDDFIAICLQLQVNSKLKKKKSNKTHEIKKKLINNINSLLINNSHDSFFV